MSCHRRLTVFAIAGLLTACSGGGEGPAPQTIEERGLSEFRACAVCHARSDPSAPGTPRLIGPSLFSVFGTPSARLADYDYSPAMRRAALIWDEATLGAYIADPQAVVPGTRMSYPGEPDPAKRAAIIAYLKTLR